MRRAALVLLLIVAAGCAEPSSVQPVPQVASSSSSTSAAPPPGPTPLVEAAAPTWTPGQYWNWTVSSRMEGYADGADVEDAFDGTLRVDVLSNVSIEGRILTLQRLESDLAHSYDALVALDPDDLSEARATPRTPTSCQSPCDLAKEVRLWSAGPPALQFPLKAGATWTSTYEGIEFAGSVLGQSTVAVGERQVRAFDVRLLGTATESGLGFTASFRLENRLAYAPELAMFVRQNVTLDVEVSAGGDRQELHGSIQFAMTGAGQGAPIPIAQAFELVGGAAPRPLPETDLGYVSILAHPGRFDAGTSWTFRSVGATEPAGVRWLVLRTGVGPFDTTLEDEGTGESFTWAFSEPGSFLLVAAILDADGEVVDADVTEVLVDQVLSGVGSCGIGASVTLVAPDDATCTGLAFTLKHGAYKLEGTAAYAQGESLLPCGSLAFYDEGDVDTSSAAWPEGDASVATIATVDEEEEWELRWNPSLSTGSDVTYEVQVTTLADPDTVPEPAACL